MNYAVKIYTFACLAFIVMLATSGSIGGITGEVVYYLSFLLPTLLCFFSAKKAKREREEISGVAEPPRNLFLMGREGAIGTLFLLAPTILLVMLLSYITSIMLTLAGASDTAVPDAPLMLMLLEHALAPSLLEEMLFRYVPLILLSPYSKRWCVVISSVYFALIHCNLFQMPYALVAGAIFIMVDLAFDSVLPSLMLHLGNNIASIVFMKLCVTNEAMLVYFIVLGVACAISILGLVAYRTRVKAKLKLCLDRGESLSTRSPIALVVLSVGVAIINLF